MKPHQHVLTAKRHLPPTKPLGRVGQFATAEITLLHNQRFRMHLIRQVQLILLIGFVEAQLV